MHDQLLAARQNNILSNFDTKRSQAAHKDCALSLLCHGFNAHCTDVATPAVFDRFVINVNRLPILSRHCSAVAHVNQVESLLEVFGRFCGGVLVQDYCHCFG